MTTAGFIGVGTMGEPMAGRLVDAGFDLVVTDVQRSAADDLVRRGARWVDTVAEVAAAADVVHLSLPGPPQVDHVMLGDGGVLANAASGTVVVDHTTNSLEMVRRVAARCATAGVAFLDAPVSGGKAGAAAGTLALMVGGDADALAIARPFLDAMGDPVLHFGEVGTGTVVKLVNNQVFLCGEVIFQEGLVLAAKAGIDPADLMALLERTGAGGAHVRNGDRVVGREFTGPGFALSLAEKDVSLALAAGRELDVPMPASGAAHERFVESLAAGLGEQRSFATLQMVERSAAFEVPRVERADGDG